MRSSRQCLSALLLVAAACKGPTVNPPAPTNANAGAPAAVAPNPAPSKTVVAPVVRPAPPMLPKPALLQRPTPGPPGTNVGDKIPSFAAELIVPGAKEPTWTPYDSHQDAQTTAFVFLGTRCPATHAYLQRQIALEKTYGEKGVRFIFVYPNRDDTPDVKRSFHREKGYRGPYIDDQGARIAKLFGATRTSEIVVVSKDRRIVFRGPIDDSRRVEQVRERFLANALDEHLAGKKVRVPWARVFA
jgi:hypothetical protein